VKSIYLHGKLGKQFGRKWTLNVDTIPEAFHAIDCNKNGFLDAVVESLSDGNQYVLLKKDINEINSEEDLEKNLLKEDEVELKIKNQEIHLVPSVEGAGQWIAAKLAEIAWTKLIVQTVIMVAISYGIAALMKPPEPPKVTSSSINTKSYVLNGAENRVSQGSPVPLGYGRLRIGSNVIGAKRKFKNLEKHENKHALESFSEIEYMDLLCEGPIVGFVDDMGNPIMDAENYDKAVFLNDVPVKNNQGLYNYILTENSKEDHSDIIKISLGEQNSFGAKNLFGGASYSRQYDTLLIGPSPYVDGVNYQSKRCERLNLSQNERRNFPYNISGMKDIDSSTEFNEIEFAKENGARIFSHIVTNTNVTEVDINLKLEMSRRNRKGDNFFNWCDFVILVQSAGKEYNVLDPDSGCVCLFNNLEIEDFSAEIITDGSLNDNPKYQFGKKYWEKLSASEQQAVNFKPIYSDQNIDSDEVMKSYEMFVQNNPGVLERYQRYVFDRKYFQIRGISTGVYEFSINIKFEWNKITEKLNNGMTFKVIKLSNEYDPTASTPDSEVETNPGTNGENMNQVGKINVEPFERLDSVYNALDGILNKRTLSVSSVAEKINENFYYPNSAVASLKFDSRNFSSVPERSYHVKMKKMLVPSNYDPFTRKYKGAWDGLFKGQSDGESIYSVSDNDKYWSDNPAWIFYDVLSNPRFGVAKYGLEQYNIDKWQLYKVAKYCDELVETGYSIETKSSVPRAFHTDNVVNYQDGISEEYGYITIKIEDYFWYLNESGAAKFSEKRFLSRDYIPPGMSSRDQIITSVNIDNVFQDIFGQGATSSEVERYADKNVTVELLISFILSYSNEELRIRATELLSSNGGTPTNSEIKDKIYSLEEEIAIKTFSVYDFKKEFGDGTSFKGKKIAFFMNKHHFDEYNDAIKQNIQQKSCLRSGYSHIEERIIIRTNASERTVTVSGPSLDIEGSYIYKDGNKYSFGGCAAQINYPTVEPRFTSNIYLTDKSEALNTLNAFSSVFRGMIAYFGGQVSVTMDYPKKPIKLFNNSNVHEGGFTYAGDYKSKKFSSAVVKFNNKEKSFRPDMVFEEDPSLMQKFGFSEKESIGFGITSRSQAQRLAKWILFTSNLEGENIKFNTSMEANYLVPGSIFEVSDEMRSGKYKSGRILGTGLYRTIKKGKSIKIFDPYIIIDKPALTLGGLSRVEITISYGARSESFQNIEARSIGNTYESDEDQDVEIENINSPQIIKFEGTLDLILDKEALSVVSEKTIVGNLILKKQFTVSIDENLILLYHHEFSEGERVRFVSDGTLPAGISSRRIHEEAYFVRNPTKHSFQLSKEQDGNILNIYSEGLDSLNNPGGIHYVCPENIDSESHFTINALNQISEGSTYSLKSYINSGIENNVNEDYLSSAELKLIGIEKDFVDFKSWTISKFFGQLYIASRQWAFVRNLGWTYIGEVLTKGLNYNLYFYVENIGWIFVLSEEDANFSSPATGGYFFFISNYEGHANISPWILNYKNTDNEINRLFVYHNDINNFPAYSKVDNNPIGYVDENKAIYLLDSNGSAIISDSVKLNQLWNSSSLKLTKNQYLSLPNETRSVEEDGKDSFYLGKDLFKLGYFNLGYNSRSSNEGMKMQITQLQASGFMLGFLSESIDDLDEPVTILPILGEESSSNPGLKLSSIKNFFAVDKYTSVSGLDCIQLELEVGHNLLLKENLDIIIEGVTQSSQDLQFNSLINSEWATIYVDEDKIELVDSISLKDVLDSEQGTINSFGLVRHISSLSSENQIYLDRKLYRVIRIKENSENKFEIIGSEYSPNKFDAIDKNISVVKPYLPIPPQADMAVPDPPEELELFDYTIRDVIKI